MNQTNVAMNECVWLQTLRGQGKAAGARCRCFVCVWCGYHGNSGTSACPSGETSDKWTGVLHMPCVMLEMTVNRAFYFVIKYLVLFVYFNHSFTTVFLEVTVVTVAHFC